jgi:TonB family protein
MLRSHRVACCLLLIGLLTAWGSPARAEESPGDLAAALDEGRLHLVRGEPGLAVDSFRRAVRISGETSSDAWTGLITALFQVQRYADAADSARKAEAAARTPEERSSAASFLGSALLAAGDVAGALPVFRELAAAPSSHQKSARESLVGALLLADRKDEAAAVLGSYRAAGATAGDVQSLLCGAGQVLSSHPGATKAAANERLRTLEPTAPLQSGDGIERPQLLTRVQPSYTEEARQARLMGVVILKTVVGADGHVEVVDVLKGLPKGLTENATEAIRQWTFKPATANGVPVPVCYLLTVNFQLQDETKDESQGSPKPQGEPR